MGSKKHKRIPVTPYLPDDEWDKAVGQLKLQLNSAFDDFHMYGMDVYIPNGIAKAAELAIDFSLRTRGLDHPIVLKKR